MIFINQINESKFPLPVVSLICLFSKPSILFGQLNFEPDRKVKKLGWESYTLLTIDDDAKDILIRPFESRIRTKCSEII